MFFTYFLVFCAGACVGWIGLALAISRIENEDVMEGWHESTEEHKNRDRF